MRFFRSKDGDPSPPPPSSPPPQTATSPPSITGPARPIRFVYRDDAGIFRIDPEAMAVLQLVKDPLGVVSVCGRARQGKSFILNQFLREQASLSAEEINTDSVENFIPESDKKKTVEEKCDLSKMGQIFEKLLSLSPKDLHPQNGSVQSPKVNGKHNEQAQKSNSKDWGQLLSRNNDVARTIYANKARPREVLPGLESWQSSKIAAWHSIEGHSIEWLSVICVDRRGIMGEVITVLASLGFSVCSCVAEIDRGKGMGVMLFHIEGSTDNMDMSVGTLWNIVRPETIQIAVLLVASGNKTYQEWG